MVAVDERFVSQKVDHASIYRTEYKLRQTMVFDDE